MPNAEFAQAIRESLDTHILPDHIISLAIGGEIKESVLAEFAERYTQTMKIKRRHFAATLDEKLTALGATKAGGIYNLSALGLSGPLRFTASEEMNAIRTHAGTAGFDGAKALANMLRMVKVAEL